MAQMFKIINRGLATSSPAMYLIEQVTVIGGGQIGTGIAQVAAQSGQKVTLVEIKEDLLKKAKANITENIQKSSKTLYKGDTSKEKEFVKSSLDNITYSVEVQESVKSANLVIEAISEFLPAKQTLFETIDLVAPDHTMFASTTSSLGIADVASVTKRKEKFSGLHFFYPVPDMKLLEVVRTEDTSQETYEHIVAWGSSIGKICVTSKDTPGFIVNRLIFPQLAEAIRLLEKGVADPKDIDIALKLGAGHPLGPIELSDSIGLDIIKYYLDGWHQKYPDEEAFFPVKKITKLVSEGKFGVKSGEGLYKYKK